MRNILRAVIPVFILLGFTTVQAQPGCPSVVTASKVTIPCGQTCTNIYADAFSGALTTSYAVNQIAYNPPFPFNSGTPVLVHTDDLWSSAINLGFNFCFYGNTFSKAIVGSNGCISFNTNSAGTTNNWAIPQAGAWGVVAAGETDMENSIMAPWQDLDPTNKGDIYYNVGGTAPCRYLEVSWYQCPMFGDPNSVNTSFCTTAYQQTQMAVIYETSNAVEVYIQQKGVPCTAWNNGYAVEGLVNGNGTQAITVPGRNATVWPSNGVPLTNDAWRFTPDGAPNYTITWFQGVTQIGTGSPIQVCPTVPTTYTASATYTNCDNSTITVTANVFVGLGDLTVSDSARQPSCGIANNGAVFANFNSSSGVISYGWAPGGAGQTTLNNIGAGTYIFTVNDSSSCSASDTIVLTGGSPIVVAVPNDTATSCSGTTNNGVLDASVTGGVPAYTYQWSPGNGSTNPLTGLNVGTYTVTVTDANGCTGTGTGSVSVKTSPLSFASPQITEVACNGGDNGQIIDPLNGGTSPITYTWSAGNGHADTLSNLSAGTYTVTAVDANGCSATASFTITQGAPLAFAQPQITEVSCNGGDNGRIIDPLSGGTSPITYNWSVGNGHTDTLSNVAAGTYTVTGTDANGCSATASFTITQPATAVSVTVANDTVTSCSGLTNVGTLNGVATGGTPGYSYLWSNSATTDTISGLASGNYSITVVDASGCTASASATVVVKSSNLSITGVVSNPICNGQKGEIIITVSGATPPVSYSWSNGVNTVGGLIDTLSGIGGGVYRVTATDANGCTASASFTVNQPSPLIVHVPNDTVITCAGNTTNGVLTAHTTGGTPGYTYSWTGNLSGNPITGLGAGTYQVTATDAEGCTATGSGSVILEANPVVFNAPQITNATCAGSSTGEIILSTSGGTAPITFTWSGGTTQDDTLRNLAGGTYNITATDVNGCSATASYTVNQASPIVFGTPVITNIGCSGGTGGAISVTATGGTGTIIYAWSNGSTVTSLTGLTAGTYCVTATDGAGCTASSCYTISQSPPIAITATVNGISCSGPNSGAIFSSVTGGSTPYTYHWSNGASSADIINVPGGGYHLTVTDANGCSATAYYIVGHDSCGACPQIVTNSNVAIPCSQTCTDLIASVFSAHQTTAYTVAPITYNPPFGYDTGTSVLVHTDDLWSNIITLPFNFCFWGVAHNKIVIGSNGEISFNTGNAGAFNNWQITSSVPFPNPNSEPDQKNVIMAPWQDLDPTNYGNIYYNISGTAPCRKFEVSWDNCPMFGDSGSVDNGYCSTLNHQTQMAVLYETTNDIDIYIAIKDTSCTDLSQGTPWNNDWAIEGIVGPSGLANQVVTVPGRNATEWVAYNDAWRFSPAGAPNYTIAWYQNGTQVGTGDSLQVCPDTATTYTVFATYTNCDNSQVIVGDSVYVTPGGSLHVTIDSVHLIQCNGDSDGAVYASYTDTSTTVTSFGWTPGGANQTSLVNIPAGTYIFTVTTATGCTKSDTVVLVNPPKVVVTVANDTFTSCTINNIGTLTANTTGGTPGYTYVWSNGETTATISGLTPGTYTITSTDSHGCTGSATATVVKVTSTLTLTSQVTEPVCIDNGSIIINVTGGTAPITYTWSPTEPNTDTLTGLGGGTWAITTTDAGGCSVTASFTLAPPVPVVIDSAILVNPNCSGSDNGSITVYASGGTGPLNYAWAPGNFGDTSAISGIPAGTYSITVTDSVGCSASASYTLTRPAPIAQDSLVIVDVTCQAQGSILVIDTGGTAPLSYSWSGGQSTDSITNQPAGNYTLTVTDAAGCSITASYTIGTAPGGVVFGPPVITNPVCHGDSGSITVNATGGHGTISYTWGTGADTSYIGGLVPGTYCVTATDTTGCSASACYTITQPASITFGVPAITNVSCNGGSNGVIIANASGGTGTIQYTWSNGGITAADSNLTVGSYCVTATDSAGCSASVCYSITQPAPIVIDSSTDVPASCTVAGSIQVFVSGGTPGYTYSWSNGMSGDSVSVSGAGTFVVTITDANGCTVTDSVYETPGVGAVIFHSPIITPVTCHGGNNGIIIAVVTDSAGGPITYAWSGSSVTSDTLTGLSAGVTYTITATDSAGCSATASYTVPQPAAITFGAPDIVEPSCNGGDNGSITVTANGGTGTITYVWGGGLTGDEDSLLTQGTYTVTATDSLGCTASMSYTVNQPAPVTFNSPTIDSIKCNGGTGGITANATGGTGTITYAWTGGSTGASITGVTVGTYCVTATDANGCSASICYTLTQPTPLVIDSGVVHAATCTVGGTVVVTVSGGTPGYTYTWSLGTSSTDSVGGLTNGGTENVTVTDANGCTATATYNVPLLPNTVVIDSGHVVNELCNGGNTGSIAVTATGGVGTLTYQWGPPGNQTTSTITGLTAGNYTVTVTDSLGCTATATYTITQPTAITNVVTTTQVTCTNQGSILVTTSGGTGPYTYQWQGSGFTGDSLGGLAAGTYDITVTDANGCSVTTSGTVTTAPNNIVITTANTEPLCNGNNNGSIIASASGTTGPYTYEWSNGQTTDTISNLTAGIYCLTVHDANGCSKSICDTLNQPATLIITNFANINATCNQPGTAKVVASGGTPAYTYNWAPGVSTADSITGLIGGSIVNVTVTDHNGCTVTGADTLAPAPPPLTIADSTIVNVICHGNSTGSISITIVGGPVGETTIYHWSPGGQTTATISGLAAGTYYVTAGDAGGCVLVDSFKITQPVAYVVTVNAQHPVVCPGACDTLDVTVNPAGAFIYTWSNGQTTQGAVYCNLTTAPTNAGVTITDNNSCTASGSDSIAAAAQIVEHPTVTNTPCSPLGGGNVVISATGGFGGLTYTYNPGGVSNSTGVFNQLAAGNYTYTVSDALGCSVDSSFTVLPHELANFDTVAIDSVDCYGFSDGSITVKEDSLYNAPFTFSIDGGAFSSGDSIHTFDSLAAGTHAIVVIDKNGCADTLMATVGQPAQPTVTFDPDTIIAVANYTTPFGPVITNFTNPEYSWTPTTGLTCATCGADSFNIKAPQVYYVTVSDSANPKCAVTDSVIILLKGPLVMPSAFTPNGDGKNDLFGPVSHTYVVVKEFHIYNRWGQLVHNSTDYWDGKFDGKDQPTGTYIYYIVGDYFDPATNTTQTGKEEGAVTLIR